MQDIYGIEVATIDGTVTTLSQYKGNLLLVVNVASKCGFTNQYAGLEELYQKYKEQGLVILGFPCNQFAGQEPGSEEDILNFCRLSYGVTFPMFSKIEVNGNNAHPLYKYLRTQCPGILGSEAIKWNFTKFLISQKGTVLKRYASSKKISEMEDEVIEQLQKVDF